jgi:hypothetical protein
VGEFFRGGGQLRFDGIEHSEKKLPNSQAKSQNESLSLLILNCGLVHSSSSRSA